MNVLMKITTLYIFVTECNGTGSDVTSRIIEICRDFINAFR